MREQLSFEQIRDNFFIDPIARDDHHLTDATHAIYNSLIQGRPVEAFMTDSLRRSPLGGIVEEMATDYQSARKFVNLPL